MTSYTADQYNQRIINYLTPLNIYDTSDNSTTIMDLQLISSRLAYLHTIIDTVFESCFLQDITAFNREIWCSIFSLPLSASNAQLSECIQYRSSLSNSDFTASGVKNALLSGGLNCNLIENFATNTITVQITEDKDLFYDTSARNDFIRDCMPCFALVNITQA